MTTNNTKAKHHHGNLRESLIEYAVTAAQSGTLDGLSIRKVTRDLSVSPAAAYRHFTDRDALMRAVAQRGFDHLAESFERVLPFEGHAKDAAAAQERFVELAKAYVAFAHDNYGLWRLMFGPLGLAPSQDAMQTRPSTYDWLGKSLRELAGFGIITATDDSAQFFAWSSIHGLSDLQASPAVQNNSRSTLIEDNCAFLIRALNTHSD